MFGKNTPVVTEPEKTETTTPPETKPEETNPEEVKPVETKKDKAGTWLGRAVLGVIPEGSIFHKAVNVADETAEELIFDNGHKASLLDLPSEFGASEIKRKIKSEVLEFLGEKLDLSFYFKDKANEVAFEAAIGQAASLLAKEKLPDFARNLIN